MKNAVFWDVAPCRFCVNRRFGGTYFLLLWGRKIRERGASCTNLLTLVPRSRIFVPCRWRRTFLRNVGSRSHIPENGILHSHRRQKLKFYIVSSIVTMYTT
jgi:hypothetical protein